MSAAFPRANGSTNTSIMKWSHELLRLMVRSVQAERGAAILVVILSLLIVSALAAAMTINGRTEVMIGMNRERAAQAQAAAEAGLNHALELTMANLRRWRANGFASPSAAMSALLRGPDDTAGSVETDRDNGSLEGLGIPRPPARVSLDATAGTAYEVRLLDDDDRLRGLVFSAGDLLRIDEDGAPASDRNSRVVVRATGYARGNSRSTLEAIVARGSLPSGTTFWVSGWRELR